MPIVFVSRIGWFKIVAVAMVLIFSGQTHAQTVGLYLFDTITDLSDADGINGDAFFDSSPGGLTLAKQEAFGAVALTSALPSVMPGDTLALNNMAGGVGTLVTGNTNAYSLANTGELAIEFWFNPQSDESLKYIAQFGDGQANGWDIYQTASGGDINVHFAFRDNTNAVTEMQTGSTFTTSSGWNHIAATIAGDGTGRLYVNGSQVATQSFTNANYQTTNSFFRLGAGQNSTFANNFMMDDLRISSAALAAGSGSGAGELAWNAPLSVAPNPSPRPADFGKQWVQSHEFTLGTWDFTDYPDFFVDANYNSSFGGGFQALHAAGAQPMYIGNLTELNDTTRTIIHAALNNGTEAFILRDEIHLEETAGFKDVADYIRSINSEALIIVGLGSSTPAYVDQVMAETQPDAVIHGFYPFVAGDHLLEDHWYRGGLTDVALVRQQALDYEVPYFAFIQTFDDQLASINPPELRRRLPSESELRAEVFTKLSAGVQGMMHFVFQDGIYEDIALVDPSGVKSPLYEPAAAVNAEVNNLGRALRHLESQQWLFVTGGVAETPEYMDTWTPNAGGGKITNIVINGVPTLRRDAVLGFFTDDEGGEYFMFVNTFHGEDLDAEEALVGFTLTFDESIDTIWRLNRLTGEVQQLNLTNHARYIVLPGGTGDLFKFGDGNFIIPEPTTLSLAALIAPGAILSRRFRSPLQRQGARP